jgi:hypothetical protein
MGIDDMVKKEISEITPDIKNRLVNAFDALTHEDLKDASTDPNEVVDRIQQKTGQPREEVEKQVKQVAQQQDGEQPGTQQAAQQPRMQSQGAQQSS